jgi:ligand-binding sensor domain-containing protein
VQLLVCAAVLHLAISMTAHALDPARALTQYGHRSWKTEGGEMPAAPLVLAQTADGYLWLGTRAGLTRFDGARFTRWQPPTAQMLASSNITTLLATPDNSLWIGTDAGLSHLHDGKLAPIEAGPGWGMKP